MVSFDHVVAQVSTQMLLICCVGTVRCRLLNRNKRLDQSPCMPGHFVYWAKLGIAWDLLDWESAGFGNRCVCTLCAEPAGNEERNVVVTVTTSIWQLQVLCVYQGD